MRITKRVRGPRCPGGLWFADDFVEVLERQEGGKWVEFGPVAELGTLRLPEGAEAADAGGAASKPAKPAAPPIDPRLLSMARELRDRWAERADDVVVPDARHDVRRRLSGATTGVPSLAGNPAPPAPLAPPALPQAA